jgi:hypothetical protein
VQTQAPWAGRFVPHNLHRARVFLHPWIYGGAHGFQCATNLTQGLQLWTKMKNIWMDFASQNCVTCHVSLTRYVMVLGIITLDADAEIGCIPPGCYPVPTTFNAVSARPLVGPSNVKFSFSFSDRCLANYKPRGMSPWEIGLSLFPSVFLIAIDSTQPFHIACKVC